MVFVVTCSSEKSGKQNRLSSNYQKLRTPEILEDKYSIAEQLLLDPLSFPTNRLPKRL